MFRYLTIIALLHTLVSPQEIPESCVTPNEVPGVCKDINHCEMLLKLVKQNRSSTSKYLRESVCGFEGTIPLVCCPETSREDVRGIPETLFGPLYPPQCGFSNVSHNRVVGGVKAKLGAWPWIAVLGYATRNPRYAEWKCGGSLISSKHVLTAAHCIQPGLYTVRIGELNLYRKDDGAHPINSRIRKITVHPEFNSSTYENDIAVLKLKRKIPFSEYIHPICLPVQDSLRNRLFVRTTPFVAGWGAIRYMGPYTDDLLEVQVPVITNDKCNQTYGRFRNAVIDNRVLCAGYDAGGKDSCQGDSGGPLMLPIENFFYYQIGVISSGFACAQPGYPGVYTRVTRFLDFIMGALK